MKLNLLVIDDDPGDVEILRRWLSKIPGWEVTLEEQSGQDIQALLRIFPEADLVFVDYMLGPRTGLEVFQALHEGGCQMPVVMLTGQGNESVAVEAMKSGVVDYIVKDSLSEHVLQKVITAAMERVGLNRQVEAQQKRLEQLATTDDLTGLLNRRYFMECLDFEVHRASRYVHPLSLLMVDLDYFKQVNDTYGHQTGDTVLEEIGGLIRKQLRTTDIAGRYGGEELTILLVDTGLGGAMRVAEKLRAEMTEKVFTAPSGETFHVTCSIGVVSLWVNDTPHTLLSRADQALYEAKHSGRNQVACMGQAYEECVGK